MPFQKGISGNPGGRPPIHKKNDDLIAGTRDAIRVASLPLLPKVLEEIENMINSDTSIAKREGIKMYLNVMEFILPKLRSVDTKLELGESSMEGISVIVKTNKETEPIDITPIEEIK